MKAGAPAGEFPQPVVGMLLVPTPHPSLAEVSKTQHNLAGIWVLELHVEMPPQLMGGGGKLKEDIPSAWRAGRRFGNPCLQCKNWRRPFGAKPP